MQGHTRATWAICNRPPISISKVWAKPEAKHTAHVPATQRKVKVEPLLQARCVQTTGDMCTTPFQGCYAHIALVRSRPWGGMQALPDLMLIASKFYWRSWTCQLTMKHQEQKVLADPMIENL